MERKAFGIDLGTTYSAIAVYENNEAHIIPNIDGSNTTPSVIFFTGVTSSGDDDMIVGQEAKNAAAIDAHNVVQFIKRNIGKSDASVNHIGPSGRVYTPEVLSSFILRKVCQDAEQRVGYEVKDVVITVPAYFDDTRRTATKQAGEIAGLNVLAVINEPTAAAIAFGLGKGTNSRVLVYDLGGGTFDVTIMDIRGNHFDVLATDGNHRLGGFNFDGRMVELIIKKLEEQGVELDKKDDALLAEIREKAEKAKRMLSDKDMTRLRFLIGGKSYPAEITRKEFEEATADLLMKTRVILENIMNEQDLNWSEIDEILPVGGSTKMPMVKKLLEELSGKKVFYKVDPDTAVAQGAAIFANTFELDALDGVPKSDARMADANGNGSRAGNDNSITISDVTSQSLGVITIDTASNREVNTIIIPHNSKIPTKRSVQVHTLVDNQTAILVQVTEGDVEDVQFVNIIGRSTLSIPPYKRNSPVEIIYAYDPDQTISIEVIDLVTNKSLGTFEIDRVSNMTQAEVTKASEVARRVNIE
ncbi:MAG: Hsp70 family protein [Lachnospiraceae bacterium]|nr:Hsp70 family protein [Lachnospiraceae bacterium]